MDVIYNLSFGQNGSETIYTNTYISSPIIIETALLCFVILNLIPMISEYFNLLINTILNNLDDTELLSNNYALLSLEIIIWIIAFPLPYSNFLLQYIAWISLFTLGFVGFVFPTLLWTQALNRSLLHMQNFLLSYQIQNNINVCMYIYIYIYRKV